MGSVRTRRSVWSALILTLLASACDGGSGPATPAAAGMQSDVDGSYTLLTMDAGQPSSSVTAEIGGEGGSLTLSGHTLTVPAGALGERLTFTLATVEGTQVQVALSARTQDGEPVTVFARPLLLSLSYAGAKVGNPNALKVAWVVGGVPVVQPSEVDKSEKLVRSWLYHFSDWGIAS